MNISEFFNWKPQGTYAVNVATGERIETPSNGDAWRCCQRLNWFDYKKAGGR